MASTSISVSSPGDDDAAGLSAVVTVTAGGNHVSQRSFAPLAAIVRNSESRLRGAAGCGGGAEIGAIDACVRNDDAALLSVAILVL